MIKEVLNGQRLPTGLSFYDLGDCFQINFYLRIPLFYKKTRYRFTHNEFITNKEWLHFYFWRIDGTFYQSLSAFCGHKDGTI